MSRKHEAVWKLSKVALKKIARQLIKTDRHLSAVVLKDLAFVAVHHGGKYKWLGKIWKARPPYSALFAEDFVACKFIVCFNMDRICSGVKSRSEIRKRLKIVMLHELLHIRGESLVPHDIEDFKLLLRRYGVAYLNERFS